jgi:hypothetical protein
MPPKLKQYLNRSVLISIPALFEDGKCRSYTLQSIEADGLWLSSNDLAARLLSDRERKIAKTTPLIFVPAVQIAAIFLPPPAAPTAQASAVAATPDGASAAQPAATPEVATATPAAARGKRSTAAPASPSPGATPKSAM